LLLPLTVDAEDKDNNDFYEKRNYIISDTVDKYKFTPQSDILILDDSSYAKAEIRKGQEDKINNLLNYLTKRNSSVFNKEIATILVTESESVGADYRLVVAIMEKESGYCNQPYKGYNCFGYLNKVQYNSFEEAFLSLTPKVAKYVAKYGWDTRAMGRAYGAVNWENWGDCVYSTAIKI
jgi:hypothetical protein